MLQQLRSDRSGKTNAIRPDPDDAGNRLPRAAASTHQAAFNNRYS